jgi:uncharacterized protein
VKLLLRRWWWVLLLVLTVVGLWRVRFDVEVLNLLPDGLSVVHGLKLYQKHFASMRELIVTVRAPEAEQAESAARQIAESLGWETNLVAGVVWQPPWIEHPEQMVELIAYLWLNQSPEAFAQLTNRLAPHRLNSLLRDSREQLATSLSPMEIGRSSYDPFGFTRLPETGLGDGAMFSAPQEGFASADGTFRAVFVEARGTLESYRTCAAWFADIQTAVGRCQSAPSWPRGATVRYTGAPPFVTEIATGMEKDIQGSVVATLVLIVLLFWWAHRSWRPLVLLMVMLVFVVAGALASGGLIFSRLNAVSLGFAAILLGLAVDYGLVIYQEWLAAPGLSARALQSLIAPSIVWSAVTTSAAFGLLNFAGLPGLSQLGSLVGIGILLAAFLMLYAFLPLVLRWGKPSSNTPHAPAAAARQQGGGTLLLCHVLTLVSACVAVGILWRAWPQVEHSSSPLQPKHSAAQLALDEMQAELGRQGDPLLLVVSGRDEGEVAQRLDVAQVHLARATTNHALRGFMLPTALWPHADRQQSNLVTARALIRQADAMKSAAAQAGFTSNALALTETLLHTWDLAAGTTNILWPTNQSSRWLLRRATACTGRSWLAVGALYPGTNGVSASTLATLDPALPGVWLTGWGLLGESLLQSVEHRLWGVMLAMIAMIVLCLWLAFRRWGEVLLSFAALGFSVLVLLAVMGVAGWSWNLMNLMALPLLLGAGVDYTIHVQLALRRHGGDAVAMRRVTGRAVFLCAATTVAGFGSNAFSSNAGLSSLGLVCASGIAIVYLASVFLVPAWWVLLGSNATAQDLSRNGNRDVTQVHQSSTLGAPISTPSSFYRAGLWRFGLAVVRTLPSWLVDGCCVLVAELHFRLQRPRREVVVQNLLPAVSGDRLLAERTARRLYRNFALKLAELWRVESGMPVGNWLTRNEEREIIRSVWGRGRGVLFITLHLGNWEHGGLLLADMGIKLTVLTLPEPEDRLTDLRSASRARWGIETLIVGRDQFAFVEVIKRLQDGGALAISVDRPPERGSVLVEMFGRPFRASIAAAELARASGCALIGVTVVRQREGYAVRLLPEFVYDRRALGSHEARCELTQQILRAFEPQISEHLDQWYHFVPIWPE